LSPPSPIQLSAQPREQGRSALAAATPSSSNQRTPAVGRAILLEAGLPAEAIACVTGPGGALGGAICTDDRVRKISFTGSYETGDAICKLAGMKRVTMELGSNSPVIVMDSRPRPRRSRSAAGYSSAGHVHLHQQRHRGNLDIAAPAWNGSDRQSRWTTRWSMVTSDAAVAKWIDKRSPITES
jgi:hypothetical protein